MALSTYTLQRFPDLGLSVARSTQSICLYYVYIGRNAWHSTWVLRYEDGCMHVTKTEAEDYAESLRENGSVIYIQELPALAIRSQSGCLVITQINCKSPLEYYSPFIEFSDRPRKRIYWLHKGAEVPVGRIVNSLHPPGAWWTLLPPTEDAVIMLATDQPFHQFDPLSNRPSNIRSRYDGVDSRLAWTPGDRVLNPNPVLRLDKMFASSGVVSPGGRDLSKWIS